MSEEKRREYPYTVAPLPRSILDGAERQEKDERFGNRIGLIPFAYHLIPPKGLARVAAIMRGGELSGREPDDWRYVPQGEGLNHVLSHIIAYLGGKRGEDHLAHAACRLLFVLAQQEGEDRSSEVPPEGSP